MSEPLFLSVLAGSFTDFIAFQRQGGAKYTTQARDLSYFDRFLCQENFPGEWPTREVIQRYFSQSEHLHPNTRCQRISVVRQFCVYLRLSLPECYVPERGLPIRQIPPRLAHIFTECEIQALLGAARKLAPPGSLRPQMYATLLGLLYTTGVRIGEAIGLNLADVQIDRRRLYVRESKFRKSRLVPFSPSTSLALANYLRARTRAFPVAPEAPFFVNSCGNRLHHQNVDKTFRTLLRHCGLRGGKGMPGPRLHDECHSHHRTCAILDSIDQNSRHGLRDYALILFLYNTGARVGEAVNLKIDDVRLEAPSQVKLLGKGRKERITPLWPLTVTALQNHLTHRTPAAGQAPYVFLNARGEHLTRYGIRDIIRRYIAKASGDCPSLRSKKVNPHTLRHTTAMHLLQSGNEITVVKDWLGHANVNTTHAYVEIDLKTKRRALEACEPPRTNTRAPRRPKWLSPGILAWLETLSQKADNYVKSREGGCLERPSLPSPIPVPDILDTATAAAPSATRSCLHIAGRQSPQASAAQTGIAGSLARWQTGAPAPSSCADSPP